MDEPKSAMREEGEGEGWATPQKRGLNERAEQKKVTREWTGT